MQTEIQQFIQAQLESTAETYRIRLGLFAAFITGKRVTPKLVNEWCDFLKRSGKSASTIEAYFSTVKAFLRWRAKARRRSAPELEKPKLPAPSGPQREAMTENEFRLLLQQVQTDSFWYPLLYLGWATGQRLTDLANLRVSQVDFKKSVITIRPMKTQRFNKTLEIPMTAELQFVLEQWWPHTDGVCVLPHAYMHFLADGHKTLSAQFSRIAFKAGVKKSFHCFRHAVVTRMVENGANPAVIASITGHSLKQIMTYCHPSLDTKRAALVA